MVYGYARVSSVNQRLYGTSLGSQKEELIAAGAEEVYSDSFTGTKENRPALDKLQDLLKFGDTIIIAKMDRIARSVGVGYKLIKGWLDKGVTVKILNLGVIENSPIGKMIMAVLLAVAEFERDMIVERTSEGKVKAKANNPKYKEGRKNFLESTGITEEILDAVICRNIDGEISMTAAAKELGCSLTTYKTYKKKYIESHPEVNKCDHCKDGCDCGLQELYEREHLKTECQVWEVK